MVIRSEIVFLVVVEYMSLDGKNDQSFDSTTIVVMVVVVTE